MSGPLHLAIRTLHVLGMAVLVGGSALVWLALRRGVEDPLALAARFEWTFWAALGVLVLTGVGNLAVTAPAPDTARGTVLTAKLLLVVAVVVGSAVRTLAVDSMSPSAAVGLSGSTDTTTRLARAYALTTGSLVVVVALAEVLAHG